MAKQLFLKAVLACVVAASSLWLLRSLHHGITHTETAENVASVDWLPKTASNVSYFRSYMNTAYEFDISEEAFREWSKWNVEEIEEPVTITRYSRFATKIAEPPQNASEEERETFVRAASSQFTKIDDGLYYAHLQDNGGGVWVAYDRSMGRAYFKTAPR